VLPVVHACWTLLVVAAGNLADPIPRIAGAVGNLLGRLATGEQPQDLPPAPLVGLLGRPVASFELVSGQMGLKITVSWQRCHQ
jgi:hypothetical protein